MRAVRLNFFVRNLGVADGRGLRLELCFEGALPRPDSAALARIADATDELLAELFPGLEVTTDDEIWEDMEP